VNTFVQIVVSGLTLGAMYAISTIALSLVWGALGMLNMAQGAFLVAGGYAAYAAVVLFGFSSSAALLFAAVVGALIGAMTYSCLIRFMVEQEGFETGVIIATVGLALIFENVVLQLFGAYPMRQPVRIEGGINIATTYVPYQNIASLLLAIVTMAIIGLVLNVTRMGRAIRAVSQNPDAARLMGVPVNLVHLQVLIIAGAVAALSGVMLSTITTLAPTMGYDPMLKAFIVCVVAGLGNIYGALYAAFVLGIFEAAISFFLGVRFGFPAMLLLVILVLIWRPYGVFGHGTAQRL
jgi:branched-chain amino acid transport system permease protein